MTKALKKSSVASRALSILMVASLVSGTMGVAPALADDTNQNSTRSSSLRLMNETDENASENTGESAEEATNPEAATFTVTFVDQDGTELAKQTDVEKGAAPEFEGDEPTKTETEKASYEFAGWYRGAAFVAKDKLATEKVTADVTYVAAYTATLKVKDTDAIAALQKRFVKTGDDAIMTPEKMTDLAAYALYHVDVELDAEGILKVFKEDGLAGSDIQRLSRWILTLTAADLDAASIKVIEGDEESKDSLLDRLAVLVGEDSKDCTIDELVWALPVYTNYTDADKVVDGMVNKLVKLSTDVEMVLEESGENEGAEDESTEETVISRELRNDVQKQAQVLLALAPHVKGEKAIAAIEGEDQKAQAEAVAQLAEMLVESIALAQNTDGGFMATQSNQDKTQLLATADEQKAASDVITTAYVISAFRAVGEDLPSTAEGNGPVEYLILASDGDMTGYATYAEGIAGSDEAAISAAALMGLEASQLTTADNKTTDVLTFPVEAKDKKSNSGASGSSSTASTGDQGVAGVAGVIALGAAGAFVLAQRRRKDQA